MIEIRNAMPSDSDSIRELYYRTFEADERELVAELACALLDAQSEPRTFALLAVNGDTLCGQIACSPVFASTNRKLVGTILAPLAVRPECQGQGCGRLLVTSGIEAARRLGAPAVLVYGDPGYYGRFGFGLEFAEWFIPPFGLKYPHGWQGLDLTGCGKPRIPVSLVCPDPLNNPSLW